MTEKGKEENRRHTGLSVSLSVSFADTSPAGRDLVWQGFLTQNFFVRTSRKIHDLIGGAITKSAPYKAVRRALYGAVYIAV